MVYRLDTTHIYGYGRCADIYFENTYTGYFGFLRLSRFFYLFSPLFSFFFPVFLSRVHLSTPIWPNICFIYSIHIFQLYLFQNAVGFLVFYVITSAYEICCKHNARYTPLGSRSNSFFFWLWQRFSSYVLSELLQFILSSHIGLLFYAKQFLGMWQKIVGVIFNDASVSIVFGCSCMRFVLLSSLTHTHVHCASSPCIVS